MTTADYYALPSVCVDCALAAGFRRKPNIAGVWVARCSKCGKVKPTCDLTQDFWPPNKDGEKEKATRKENDK